LPSERGLSVVTTLGCPEDDNPLSYDRLDGDWALYYKVARGFVRRVKPEDRGDFLHDLLLVMAKVKAKYNLIGKPLSEAGLIRVACYEVADYWRKWFKRINGRECGQCSQTQRRKCREEDLYRECLKAIRMESLDKVIEDGNGDSTELHEMIADDNAVDVVARLEARLTLQSYPHRFVTVAYKKYAGYQLTKNEQQYYWREAKKAQKKLVLV
jgi:hypothetical protein